MAKSFKITVRGKTYSVQVDDTRGSPVTVWVDGEPLSVEWQSESGGPSRAAAPPLAIEPSGHSTVIEPRGRPALAGKGVTAPMPGKIIAVKVEVGQKVAYGTEMVVLEAMKMEQSIRSTVDGVVRAVLVHPGQAVSYGQLLVELEQ